VKGESLPANIQTVTEIRPHSQRCIGCQ
jgi:hypothetical protein